MALPIPVSKTFGELMFSKTIDTSLKPYQVFNKDGKLITEGYIWGFANSEGNTGTFELITTSVQSPLLTDRQEPITVDGQGAYVLTGNCLKVELPSSKEILYITVKRLS